jgi:hypothetical protein
MGDEPFDPDEDEAADEELLKTRKLIASVEELRALLAPLTPDEREQVLALAREIADRQ